ncbi:unnamed protein product [Parnassius apollo]|uniref:(apollo) hypothetical protein n=1 Tax=Parnassius apollo TaxID=110799 RepID=A0A8S3W4J7_PARAO|nr:unnamed protein product [Parnassius apollo]
MWFMTSNNNGVTSDSSEKTAKFQSEIIVYKTETKPLRKTKNIPLFLKGACSVLQIFTERPEIKRTKPKEEKMETDNNTITVIGITTFLIILTLNALLDVLKVKEEERARRKLNPDGERRHSLAEFANKKMLRRESSKFSLQLFQIAETVPTDIKEDKNSRRESRPYRRGESINSYLNDKKTQGECSAPASLSDSPVAESKLVKRQSVAKLFGLSDG